MDLPFDPAVPLLEIYPKEPKTLIRKNISTPKIGSYHPYIHCSVIYISQDMEASQVFVSRRVDETTMEHLYNGIVHSHKKEESLTLCDSMDGPGGHYAK